MENKVCPHCGCNPKDEPYCMNPTHCPMCGYVFKDVLPKGLKLFIADIIDEETEEQEFWYVVGRTQDSALKRFKKWADNVWWRYAYYFNEVEDADEIENFIESNEDIKAGIYEQ